MTFVFNQDVIGSLLSLDLVLNEKKENASYNDALGAKKIEQRNQNIDPPVTVAYAASFIFCTDPSSSGLVDASLVLRHSIHKISSRNPESGSKYDYKMYALVHRTRAIKCVDKIKELGFEVILVDPPVDPEQIQDNAVRKRMPNTPCCAHHEFIKLHAYNLPEELFVHVDLDFSFHKPMDHLFDALLYDKDSPEGKAARDKLELQFPEEHVLPDRIDAFITRDWAQVAPFKGWKSGFQAGFLVGRRDPSMVEDVSNIVLTHSFNENGYTNWDTSGWGGKGYGWFIVGEVGMQGAMAYFYDQIRPNTTVELNLCRFNHLGADSTYTRGGPYYWSKHRNNLGKCRDERETCEQCKFTAVEDIYSIHYSPCGKPWDCLTEGRDRPSKSVKKFINIAMVDAEHCFELQNQWHSLRADLEKELFLKTGDGSLKRLSEGEFKTETFLGHCRNETDYISLLDMSSELLEKTKELY